VTSNDDVVYYSINLANQVMFTELGSGAEPGWGTLYYAMKSVSEIRPFLFVKLNL
jgi:hypothetical protein